MKRFAIALLLFLIIFSSWKREAAKSISIPYPIPLIVNIDMIDKNYENDEAAAEKNYKGKSIQIAALVYAVEPAPGNASVTLQAAKPSTFVKCSFDDDQLSELAKLKKGQPVIIEGMCQGKYESTFVRQCKIFHIGNRLKN